MSDVCTQKARAFYKSLGSPVDVTAVREVGWRKMTSGATTYVMDFATVKTNEQIVIEVAPTCPRCGETMERRQNSKTGGEFWGCSSYPDCKGTRPI